MAGHFHLGELIEVIAGAPEPLQSGSVGTITAVIKVDSAELVFRHGVPFGTTLFTVEFADGREADLAGEWLQGTGEEPEEPESEFKILG
jgi:hypothetical protein